MAERFSVSDRYRFAEPRPIHLWPDFALVLEALKQSMNRALIRFPFTSRKRLAIVRYGLCGTFRFHRMILGTRDENRAKVCEKAGEPTRRLLPHPNALQEKFYWCTVTPIADANARRPWPAGVVVCNAQSHAGADHGA